MTSDPDRRLEGLTAAVTGAGQGLGQAVALGLAGAGANVAVLEAHEASGQQTVKDLERLGSKSLLCVVDVSLRDPIDDAFEAVEYLLGSGLSPRPSRMSSSAPKAAVLMMTRIAASEWGQYGVRVNAVAPGFMKTPMHDADVARGTFDEGQLLAAIPLGRLGAPQDLAKLVIFLASSDSSYITGACITIDGGLTTIPSA